MCQWVIEQKGVDIEDDAKDFGLRGYKGGMF